MGIEHSKHIFRVFILLAVVVAAAFIGRIVFIGNFLPSFGLFGHYRADAVAENAAIEVRHGEVLHEEFQKEGHLNKGCGGCHVEGDDEIRHDEIVEIHDGGPHKAVPCEDCHDALATHVREGVWIAEMPRVTSILELCARCHAELIARPADFPQVDIETHPVEQGAEEASDEVCFDCHSPHDPTP